MNCRIEIKLNENEWIYLYNRVKGTPLLDFLKKRRYIKRQTKDEIVAGMLSCLEDWFGMSPSHVGYLEKCGFRTIAAMVFLDEEAAKLFDERLTEEQKRAIAGVGMAG